MKRTQLNVSIDPKLLEKIKESARISGKSLVGFVSDCFVNQIENLPFESIDSRFHYFQITNLKCLQYSVVFQLVSQ
jgi:hypothetical protein